ncbi:MAG: helix-turn-helix transcriptional regulator [Candidatus Omnitrophota bacterium]|nr:helix-turn-helix transcriptional regulator [Candidatus Omnitrophota bacterium]
MEKELQDWYQLHQFHLYSGSYETKDLADFLGVNPRTIQRWLKEKTKPKKEQLLQIKKYLFTQKEPKVPS